MATTFVDYTGDGNATKSFSFPSYKVEDIKVEVDNVIKTVTTHYNITSYTTTGGGNVVFTSGNIPSSPAAIRIFRDTDVDSAKATYTAGSAVKADDLNNNMTQLLYAAQEEQNQTILTSHIKDSAITSAKIDDGTIVNADVNASAAIAGTKISPDFGSQNIATTGTVDGRDVSADGTKLDTIETNAKDDQTAAEIRTLVESASDSNVFTDADHSKLNGIESGATADQTNAEIRTAVEAATDSNVFTDADHSKLNGIEAGATADQTITEIKSLIAGSPLDASHLAPNSVTTSEIADAELSTLAGMQSGTASKLADSTALTADIADLNQIDGMAKQTTITDDDTKFPTSGAVVDYVAAQLEPFGGFEAIANESSFPNTQPVSGVVISIADAGGMVVSGSGTASGATVGGTTVNITGIASNFNGSTVNTGVRFLVVSTGSGQNYTYHKATLKEDDLVSLSGDINDFSERYRVGASNPTTSLDSGDLFFNTGSGKLLVYNGSNSAWEETQSVGNFFINTISSSSATGGGSATPNGTAYRFTISNAGANAQQHIVSVDGVIQKPNSGTSQPSEGFAIDGGDIIFGSAPVNGASIFVITIGASVSIGTPSNNTVTSAILQNGSVIEAKLGTGAVVAAKIGSGAVTQAKIGGEAIDEARLQVSNSPVNGYFLSAQSGNTGGLTWAQVDLTALSASNLTSGTIPDARFPATLPAVSGANLTGINTDLVADTSPQLGGNLDTNDHHILVDDNHYVYYGDSEDLKIGHDGTNSYLQNTTGVLYINNTTGSASNLIVKANDNIELQPANGETGVKAIANGAVELYHNNTRKFQTDSNGVYVNSGSLYIDSDNEFIALGNANDFKILHDGTDNVFQSTGLKNFVFKPKDTDVGLKILGDGAVELYYDNSKKFETSSIGFDAGDLKFRDTSSTDKMLTIGNTDTTTARWSTTRQGIKIAGSNPVIYGHTTTDSKGSYLGLSNGQVYLGASESGQILFQTSGSGTSGTNRWYITADGHFRPASNDTYDIGTTSDRVRNIYTNDLHLSNEGGSNDVDGSWGNWTIQEGESDLFLKNNRSGKKYKFNLTEVS